MNIIEKIVLFFKGKFHKKTDVKMIDVPLEPEENKNDFVNSLKIDKPKKSNKKKKVETLTCFGDGLGIQNKIDY